MDGVGLPSNRMSYSGAGGAGWRGRVVSAIFVSFGLDALDALDVRSCCV